MRSKRVERMMQPARQIRATSASGSFQPYSREAADMMAKPSV